MPWSKSGIYLITILLIYAFFIELASFIKNYAKNIHILKNINKNIFANRKWVDLFNITISNLKKSIVIKFD
jgi:hypothetical protein